MDPLSITSSAAGLASLGITVSGGLIQYCKRFRSRDSDLSRLMNHAEQLESFVGLIHVRTSGSHKPERDTDNLFQRCRDACDTCLQDFKQLNAKYCGPGIIRKLKYPFDKEEFDDLRVRLQGFHIMLLGQMQLIHLDATREMRSVVISESKKLSLAVESLGRQLQSSISSAEHATTGLIHSGFEHMEFSFKNSLQGTENHVLTALTNQIQCLCEQVKEGQQNQTSDIANLIDQRFQASQGSTLMSPRSSGGNIQRSLAKSNKSHLDRDQFVDRRAFSKVPIGDILSSLCQCPMIRQRGSSTQHEKGCIYSVNNRKKRGLTATFRVFQRKVTAAWEFEYFQLAWARDWRINRNLTIQAVVPDDSPAFKVISKVNDELKMTHSMRDLEIFLRDRLVELQQIFANGRAWPTDVTEEGYSLLLSAVLTFGPPLHWAKEAHLQEATALMLQFILGLIQLGVPLNESCPRFGTPLQYALFVGSSWENFGNLLPIISRFIDEGAILQGSIGFEDTIAGIISLPTFTELSEPLACTEFLGQILRRSERDVARLLHADNFVLHERTTYNQTPLHLAANWPKGLHILIELGGEATTRSIINVYDNFMFNALHYAVWLKDFDSIRVLLNSGAGVDSRMFHVMRFVDKNGEHEPIIIQSIARQRRELLQLALLNLSSKIIEDIGLQGDILIDDKAFEVAETLRQQGVVLPTAYDCLTPTCGSVYHWPCLCFSVAQSLFDVGFQKTNTKVYGCTPLMLIWAGDLVNYLRLIGWFESHGADLHDPLPVRNRAFDLENGDLRPTYRMIHALAYRLGERAADFSRYPEEEFLNLKLPPESLHQITTLLEDRVADPCLCYCTVNGCTTASHYARELFGHFGKDLGREPCILNLADPATHGRDGCKIASELIRVLVFNMLDMTHTCCWIETYPTLKSSVEEGLVHLKDPEEIQEIREEERYLAELLETLMEEFSAKFQDMKLPLGRFVEEYLWPRMQEIEKQKDVMSSEEMHKLKSIGVVLEEL